MLSEDGAVFRPASAGAYLVSLFAFRRNTLVSSSYPVSSPELVGAWAVGVDSLLFCQGDIICPMFISTTRT